ncbi:MAG: phage integrase SAM-like domain-containing protein, partial [Alloprevotella sp.]|nr:phage integrase SAM-like domain-containing protein [Alloprevotella sp.]
MLTIKAEVQGDRRRKDGTYNVKIRFTKGKVVKRISTNLFATEADLTQKLKFKESSNIKQEADRLVLHYRTQLAALGIDVEGLELNEIVCRLLNKDEAERPIDFIAFSREWIGQTTIKGKDNYSIALNSFVRFIGREELNIKLITVELLEQYRDYLIKREFGVRLGNNPAFVNNLNVHLRLFGHEIVCDERGEEVDGKVVNGPV